MSGNRYALTEDCYSLGLEDFRCNACGAEDGYENPDCPDCSGGEDKPEARCPGCGDWRDMDDAEKRFLAPCPDPSCKTNGSRSCDA